MDYIDVIRSNYAAMPDDALSELWKERKGLTPEAFGLLKEELAARLLLPANEGINSSEMTAPGVADPSGSYSRAEMKAFWQLIINMKCSGKPDEVILGALQVKGMRAEEAAYMLQETEPAVLEKINQADSE